MIRPALLLALSTALIAACGSPESAGSDVPPKADLTEEAAFGEQIVAERCVSCHSVGGETASPNPLAPSLSTVLANYDEEALFDDFRSGIHVGHETMPTFDFSIAETDALLAYLKTLQD